VCLDCESGYTSNADLTGCVLVHPLIEYTPPPPAPDPPVYVSATMILDIPSDARRSILEEDVVFTTDVHGVEFTFNIRGFERAMGKVLGIEKVIVTSITYPQERRRSNPLLNANMSLRDRLTNAERTMTLRGGDLLHATWGSSASSTTTWGSASAALGSAAAKVAASAWDSSAMLPLQLDEGSLRLNRILKFVHPNTKRKLLQGLGQGQGQGQGQVRRQMAVDFVVETQNRTQAQRAADRLQDPTTTDTANTFFANETGVGTAENTSGTMVQGSTFPVEITYDNLDRFVHSVDNNTQFLYPQGMVLLNGSNFVLVVDTGHGAVKQVDMGTGVSKTLLQSDKVGSNPYSIALDPTQKYAFVADASQTLGGSIKVVDLYTLKTRYVFFWV